MLFLPVPEDEGLVKLMLKANRWGWVWRSSML